MAKKKSPAARAPEKVKIRDLTAKKAVKGGLIPLPSPMPIPPSVSAGFDVGPVGFDPGPVGFDPGPVGRGRGRGRKP